MTNPHAGIAWDFRLYATDPQLAARPLRGVFWLPNTHADGFIVIQNTSEEASSTVSAKLIAGGKAIPIPSFELAPEGAYRLDLRDYLKAAGFTAEVAGGIEIKHAGGGALIAHGALYDMHGFSAEVDMRRELGDGKSKTYTLRTPRAALGSADPTLGLARDVSFTPTLILHNFSSAAVATDLLLATSGDSSPTRKSASYSLAAGETRLINLAKFFPSPKSHWISTEVRFESTTNHVGAELISVSQNGNHTLRSMMNHVGGALREGWYWRVGDDHNTLLAIFNPEDHSAKADVSLDFKTGSSVDKYNLGQRVIPAHGTEIIDIGAIAASGKPDSTGKVLPKNTEGGYRVTGIRAPKRQLGNLMTEALVFDRKRKTFETYYNTCCNTNASHTPFSFSGSVGGTGQMFVSEWDSCTGITTDVTPYASYSSSNSSIARANPSGRVDYLSSGNTSVRSTWSETRWIHIDEGCYDVPSSVSRPTTVKPRLDSISPAKGLIGTTISGITITGAGFGTSATVSAGPGITVTYGSRSNTSITVTFAISATAFAGNHAVTVTANGETSSPAKNFYVLVPHHLRVVSDTTAVLCTNNQTKRRIITDEEVDSANVVVGTIQTREQFGSKSANTCNTAIDTSETCSPDSGGILTDALTVGCNNVGGSCGFTYTAQKWVWCKPDGSSAVIATPGDLVVHNNSISVGGNTTGFPPGTNIFP